jgi:hypothetical protein
MKKISIKDLLEQEDIFKGIRQSAIDTVEALNKVQTELKDSAKIIQNDIKNSTTDSAKGLKEFSNAATAASKVMKDAAIVAQQQAKAEQQKIKVDQEIIKLEKLKAQEIARATKEAEKAAKLAAQESSAYAQLSKELNNARKAYKDLAVTNQENTTEGKELLATITQLDAQLKEVDATVGQHQRNVGNYGEATKSLKLQLRELTQALQQMDESDPRFQQMAQDAAELKDKIDDTGATIRATTGNAVENLSGAFLQAGQLGVAAFQGVEASLQLMGIENENVLEGMRKLQALAALSDSLKTLGELDQKYVEIKASLTAALSKLGLFTSAKQVDTVATAANTVAAGANTTATVAQTTATNAANTATKGLNASMLLNPYVLVAAAIAAMAVALYKLTQASDDEKRAEQARQEVQEENLQLSKETNAAAAQEASQFVILTNQLRNTNAGSRERKDLIDKINSTYGTTLQNLSNEAAFQAHVTQTVQDFINKLKEKIQLQRNEKKLTQAIEGELNAREKVVALQLELSKVEEKIAKAKYGDIKFGPQRDILKERIKIAQEDVKVSEELAKVYAEKNLKLQENNDLNENYVPPPPPPIAPQQNYNKELEKTVDLTKEIQDEQTKQITDAEERSKTQLQLDAQRRIKEIKESTATAEQKAQLIKLVEENLTTDINKIYDDYYKDLRDKAIAQAEWIKKNKEDLAEQERQENIKLYNDSVTQEDKQNHAKLASLDGEQKKEFEERLAFQKELNELNQLYFDGAFASQEDYEKAVANLKKKYQADDIEKAKKANEEMWQSTQEFAQKTTDYFKKQSDERISQMDKEIAAAEKQADYYRELAANGNINAQQSLAEQERIIAESNRRKEREQKRQQRMQLANTIYQTYAGHAAKDPDTALMKTIKDAGLLQAFISTLPMFYDGTEDTGTNGRGIDGKGGFHAVLHPHERVLPRSLNDQIGNLSNEELARIAQDYQNGRLAKYDVAHSSMDFALMVNKIDELKDVIKNKPETNIALGEITQSAMQIVHSTKKGNTTVYNRFKVSK